MLDVVVPARLLGRIAHEQALGALTFEPVRAEDVRLQLGEEHVRALCWSAAALMREGLGAMVANGYGLLVASELVRMDRRASMVAPDRTEQRSARGEAA